MARLIKSVIDAIQAPSNGDKFYWDDNLKGFGLRVKKSGVKTFCVHYRNQHGQSKRTSIGQYGKLTPGEAREAARKMLASVALGDDPAALKTAARRAWTMKQLCDAYVDALDEGTIITRKRTRKKPSTIATDKGRIARHIVPLLGSSIVAELATSDINRFVRDIQKGKTATDLKTGFRGRAIVKGGAGTARRTAGLLQGILSHAIDLGIRQDNPAHGLKLAGDGRRKVEGLDDKYAALGAALTFAERDLFQWQAVEAVWLLAFTGCRRGEISNLKWSEIDMAGNRLCLGESKTGESVRPLGAAAVGRLRAIRARGHNHEWVFPGVRDQENAYGGLPKAWLRIVRHENLSDDQRSALSGFTMHGLRHGFGTIAGGRCNLSSSTIGAMLGHARAGITERYISATVDQALINAATEVSLQISKLMEAPDDRQ